MEGRKLGEGPAVLEVTLTDLGKSMTIVLIKSLSLKGL